MCSSSLSNYNFARWGGMILGLCFADCTLVLIESNNMIQSVDFRIFPNLLFGNNSPVSQTECDKK